MDTDRKQRASTNAPGWKWIADQGIYLWWDGQHYTARSEWDGAQWQVRRQATPPVRTRSPKEALFIACWFVALTGLGILTLSTSGLLRSQSGDQCNLDQQFDAVQFGVLWMVGVAVAAGGATILTRRLRARTEALLLIGGAVVLPLLMLVGAAMNCSNY